MKILGIETSCDETAAAIVEDGRKILANVVTSSKELHKKTGGIIPEVAAREQVKCIIPVIEEALKQSTINNQPASPAGRQLTNNTSLFSDVDAMAVTIGPGLIGSLLVGVETAKTISFVTGVPIVPANHIFAHIYANWLSVLTPAFPAIALVVSGGHTELFLIKNHQQLKWLGGTRDDAAGEAFDKTARLLGLGFPGGPAIAAEAAKLKIKNARLPARQEKLKIKLPRPMIDEDTLDFSFSGLKTAVMREMNTFKSMNQWNNEAIQQFAHEIQESITDVLVDKTIKAAQKYRVKSILLGGGVAANQRLKEKFQSTISNQSRLSGIHDAVMRKNLQTASGQLPITLHVPPPMLCTDNAAYIASFAYFHNKPIPWQKIQAQPNLSVEV